MPVLEKVCALYEPIKVRPAPCYDTNLQSPQSRGAVDPDVSVGSGFLKRAGIRFSVGLYPDPVFCRVVSRPGF